MVQLLAVASVSGGIATYDHRPLGSAIDLPVGPVQGCKQEEPSLQTAGIAHGRDGHIQTGSWTGKRGKAGGNKDRCDIVDLDGAGRDLNSHVLQDVGQSLRGK